MKAEYFTDTLEDALVASGFDAATAAQKARLLSDNGSQYISGDLAKWLDAQKMDYARGTPHHPQTQGKIERWHQKLKNPTLLENFYLPDALEQAFGQFIDHYITIAAKKASAM